MIDIRTILCPVDFSANSEHALEYALALAQAYHAELVLLHVVQPATYGVDPIGAGVALPSLMTKEMNDAALAQLRELTARVQPRYALVSPLLITGVPFLEIIHQARERQVDLIVMGTRGRSGLSHILIGSCAERVVRKAPCPVLTVKHPEHDFIMP